jgi:hypothetical protein
LHDRDRDGSDLDLPADTLPDATLFDLGCLQDELESLLGMPVELPHKFHDKVISEAAYINEDSTQIIYIIYSISQRGLEVSYGAHLRVIPFLMDCHFRIKVWRTFTGSYSSLR